MTGYDIQFYNKVTEKIKENGCTLIIEGDKLHLKRDNGISLGKLDTVEQVYYFLCGYEWGRERNIHSF